MKAIVRSCVGDTDEFKVKVGLHQGSALSPYIFDLVMDVIVDRVKKTPPGPYYLQMTLLFAERSEKRQRL